MARNDPYDPAFDATTIREALGDAGFQWDSGQVLCNMGELWPVCSWAPVGLQGMARNLLEERVVPMAHAMGLIAFDAEHVYFVHSGESGIPKFTRLPLPEKVRRF